VEDGLLYSSRFNLNTDKIDAPPARLQVRTHEVMVAEGDTMVIESKEAPNLPPGLTSTATSKDTQSMTPKQRTKSWL
jgi:hypothetical protein